MIHAIRLVRANPLTDSVGKKASESAFRFRQVITLSRRPENPASMEQSQKTELNNPQDKSEDVMSNSFGEGYATRSDEEGFGGMCGGSQQIPKVDIDKDIHENHPAYDNTQGSEVKEKETSRHQNNASN